MSYILEKLSLECSRAGASAVGLWATHQLLPPIANGDFARTLTKSRNAALKLASKINNSKEFHLLVIPETDIVVWAVKGKSLTEMNEKAQNLFTSAAKNDLHLSLVKVPSEKFLVHNVATDAEAITCLRSVLMKP